MTALLIHRRHPILSFTVSKRKGSVSCLLSQHEKTDLLQKVSVFSPVLFLQPPAWQCFVVLESLLTSRTENSLSAGKTPPCLIQCSVTTFQISRLSKAEQLVMFSKRYYCTVSHLPIVVHINFWQEPRPFRNSFCCCCDIILLFQFSHLKQESLVTSFFADRADIYKPVVERS